MLVLMLSTVTFDGFTETSAWIRILITTQGWVTFFVANAFTAVTTAGLIVAPVAFLVELGGAASLSPLALVTMIWRGGLGGPVHGHRPPRTSSGSGRMP